MEVVPLDTIFFFFGTTGQGVKFSQLSNCFDWHFLRSWWWVALKGTLSEAWFSWFSWIMELTVCTSGYVSCVWSIGLPLMLPCRLVCFTVFRVWSCFSFACLYSLVWDLSWYNILFRWICYMLHVHIFCGESVFAVVSFAAFVVCCLCSWNHKDTPSCGRCRKIAFIEMIRFLGMSVPSMIVCLKTTI